MILLACVDNQNGMLFNRRRQSQDRLLRAHILALAAPSGLWMNAYSAGQFSDPSGIHTAEDFLAQAGPGEYCFLENTDPLPFRGAIEQVILYRWNRDYPADTFFPLKALSLELVRSRDLAGSSHKIITEEVYQPCGT